MRALARFRPWLCLALLPFAGCRFWDRRMADLHDSVLYRVNTDALGFAAVAKVGPAEVAVGGWYSDGGWGKDTWWQMPGEVLTRHGIGVPFTTLGPLGYGQSWSRLFATSTSGNHPADPANFDDVRAWLGLSDVFDRDREAPCRLTTAQKIVDLFGVEVGVAPVFWNVHLGFNVAEFADFLLGFVFLDVFGDDGVPRPPTLPMLPSGDEGGRRRAR